MEEGKAYYNLAKINKKVNFKKCIEYLKLSYDLKYIPAFSMLGLHYYKNDNNKKLAIKVFTQGGEKYNCGECFYHLANLYKDNKDKANCYDSMIKSSNLGYIYGFRFLLSESYNDNEMELFNNYIHKYLEIETDIVSKKYYEGIYLIKSNDIDKIKIGLSFLEDIIDDRKDVKEIIGSYFYNNKEYEKVLYYYNDYLEYIKNNKISEITMEYTCILETLRMLGRVDELIDIVIFQDKIDKMLYSIAFTDHN